jgi:2-polyprenyl-6-methoxyphenol hydroxylase-like FAD-dependent oxidoreductase
MAGLTAARVLDRFFDEIMLVDRDEIPDEAAPRAGVPQARHVHALIARGARELEAMFPGFSKEYEARGAVALDVPWDGTVLRTTGWQKPLRSDTEVWFATRDLTESIVRRRIREIEKIQIIDRTDVTSLGVAPEKPGRISVVHATRKDGGANLTLEADLVIDATGRTSKAPTWLESLGFPAAREEIVDCHSGYGSRWYEMPEASEWPSSYWWKLVWLDPLPPEHLMGGVLFPVEGRRFIVTLIGYSKNYPPSDEAGFDEALRKLRSPILAEMTARCKPISPVYASRALKNRLRRYDQIEKPARGFVAVSDSVCTFNPMYGQGMTIATLSARALEETLERVSLDDPAFERAFFAAQQRKLKDAWSLATSADMRFPGVVSDLPMPTPFQRFVSKAMQHALIEDPVVVRRMMPMLYLLKPTKGLFEKDLFARILAHGVVGEARARLFPKATPPRPPERRS